MKKNMKTEVKSGDFLEDVDIEITIRSGKTDIKVLQNLVNAILASTQKIVDTNIVLTEQESKVKVNSDRKLSSIKSVLQI